VELVKGANVSLSSQSAHFYCQDAKAAKKT
jgi:hypothetical protein